MTDFKDLQYVADDGTHAPVDQADPDNPFFGKSKRARITWGLPIHRVEWAYRGQKKTMTFDNADLRAALDPRCDLLVVNVGDKDAPPPNNALVIRADGSLDHQVIVPRLVRKGQFDPVIKRWIEPPPGVGEDVVFPRDLESWKAVEVPGAGEVYRVERVSNVRVHQERILINLDFAYEWYEARYYDPSTRKWGEREYLMRR